MPDRMSSYIGRSEISKDVASYPKDLHRALVGSMVVVFVFDSMLFPKNKWDGNSG